MRTLPVLFAVCMLASCDDMAQQPRYDPYEQAELFPGGSVPQPPIPGTVAFEEPERVSAPTAVTAALLERGQRGFAAFCAPCHGLAGQGDGMVAGRYVPHPPSFHDERLRAAAPPYIVHVITEGFRRMPSHAHQVEPAERWAIAWYVKALQRHHTAPPQPVTSVEPPVSGTMTALRRERLEKERLARTRIPGTEAMARLAGELGTALP